MFTGTIFISFISKSSSLSWKWYLNLRNGERFCEILFTASVKIILMIIKCKHWHWCLRYCHLFWPVCFQKILYVAFCYLTFPMLLVNSISQILDCGIFRKRSLNIFWKNHINWIHDFLIDIESILDYNRLWIYVDHDRFV